MAAGSTLLAVARKRLEAEGPVAGCERRDCTPRRRWRLPTPSAAAIAVDRTPTCRERAMTMALGVASLYSTISRSSIAASTASRMPSPLRSSSSIGTVADCGAGDEVPCCAEPDPNAEGPGKPF